MERSVVTKTAEGLAVDKATERIRRTYDRAALWYDLQEWLPERLAFRRWRRQLWTLVPDGRVLEVGVGTGRNFPCYHDGLEVTAIDLSPRMLRRAETRAKRDGINLSLALMDAQALDFQDSTFDSVVSTFVFCSVPDPIIGLQEIRRVLKPGGRVYLLEHVLSRARVLRWFMQRINGVWRAMSGANINRDTVANVEQAGLRVVEVRDLAADVVKLILAEKAD
jgi:phosphatidylethanolamine/phosphatidyl-N-methylethanolamine N-methyltransferase